MPTKDQSPTFTLDTVAVLVAALLAKGITLGMKDYEEMARLEPNRTASSFDHQFRKVKARAKELSGSTSMGGAPATPKNSNTKTAGKAAKNGSKRGHKADSPLEGDDDDDEETESPLKKIKAETVDDVFL